MHKRHARRIRLDRRPPFQDHAPDGGRCPYRLKYCWQIAGQSCAEAVGAVPALSTGRTCGWSRGGRRLPSRPGHPPRPACRSVLPGQPPSATECVLPRPAGRKPWIPGPRCSSPHSARARRSGGNSAASTTFRPPEPYPADESVRPVRAAGPMPRVPSQGAVTRDDQIVVRPVRGDSGKRGSAVKPLLLDQPAQAQQIRPLSDPLRLKPRRQGNSPAKRSQGNAVVDDGHLTPTGQLCDQIRHVASIAVTTGDCRSGSWIRFHTAGRCRYHDASQMSCPRGVTTIGTPVRDGFAPPHSPWDAHHRVQHIKRVPPMQPSQQTLEPAQAKQRAPGATIADHRIGQVQRPLQSRVRGATTQTVWPMVWRTRHIASTEVSIPPTVGRKVGVSGQICTVGPSFHRGWVRRG